jgi:serine/threonine-protein kinase
VIGRTASHYRILERLGEGGMGEVFLAEDLRLHRRVALKMLRAETVETPESRARLIAEARLASSLTHPGIAVIYEIDELEQDDVARSFIAMEYAEGETLARRVSRGALAVDEALDVVLQVADALADAHARGVVHRDIKPSNVMLTSGGRIKVLDFGVAQYAPAGDADSTWSGAPGDRYGGALAGTVGSMSPEQIRGREIDARADVFSMGVLLHELLTGRRPFLGDSAVDVVDAILHADPPPLDLDDPRVADLGRVLRRMMAKDAGARFVSMREAAVELRALRARGAQGAASLPLAAASPAVAVMGFANITGNADDDWLGTGIAETVTADLKAVEGLSVIARERIHEVLRRLAGDAAGADEALAVRAGRQLDARWVLTGAYQRLGASIRVTARLVEVETAAIVRTVKIDGRLDEIFTLQDRLVAELSAGLRRTVSLGGEERDETGVVDAYEAFSRGVVNMRTETHESVDRAILFFERAVALDPSYARAHLQLGSALELKADYLVMPELYEKALGHLRRAVELRPGLALAWREIGAILAATGREEEGLEAIRRALSLDPTDPSHHTALGRVYFIACARFDEAARAYERALQLNPRSGWAALQLAHCAILLRDLPRAEAAARQAAELQEAHFSGHEGVLIVGSHMRLGQIAALRGEHTEALAHFGRELDFFDRVDHALRPRTTIELRLRLGSSRLQLGDAAGARRDLDAAIDQFERRVRLGADEPFSRYYAACAHALRGDREAALVSLERAARSRRAFTAARARIEPDLSSLRGHPRFEALIAP